jgi:hypothetical protein
MVRPEPGLAGQAPRGSLWQVQTGGSRTKAKYKHKVLEMQCQESKDQCRSIVVNAALADRFGSRKHVHKKIEKKLRSLIKINDLGNQFPAKS